MRFECVSNFNVNGQMKHTANHYQVPMDNNRRAHHTLYIVFCGIHLMFAYLSVDQLKRKPIRNRIFVRLATNLFKMNHFRRREASFKF